LLARNGAQRLAKARSPACRIIQQLIYRGPRQAGLSELFSFSQPLFFLRLSRERASCFGLLAAAAIPQHVEIAVLSYSVSAAQLYNCEKTNVAVQEPRQWSRATLATGPMQP